MAFRLIWRPCFFIFAIYSRTAGSFEVAETLRGADTLANNAEDKHGLLAVKEGVGTVLVLDALVADDNPNNEAQKSDVKEEDTVPDDEDDDVAVEGRGAAAVAFSLSGAGGGAAAGDTVVA